MPEDLPALARTVLIAAASTAAAAAFVAGSAAQTGPQENEEVIERGRLVASGGEAASTACFSCHGMNGEGDAAGVFPKLAGLDPHYLYKQLDDYANGSRPNDIMTPIAEALSEEDRAAVAVYYSTLEAEAVANNVEIDPGRLQAGGVLWAQGSAELNVPACVNCHGGEDIGGLSSIYPALDGQHASYLAGQLLLWKQGIRNNDIGGIMRHIGKQLPEEDIEAVAAYLSRLD
jgi:cytochrome c553